MKKSSVEEIRQRFDADVERFANLDLGQTSTIDAQHSLELITESARRLVPNAKKVLDIGCGAGNYTLKMLSKLPNLQCTLVDLSEAMLYRACERIRHLPNVKIEALKGDIRDVKLKSEHYDIILAGAVLHHLREDQDWENIFSKLFGLLRPGGCLMISDLVTQGLPFIKSLMWEKYGEYLEQMQGKEYREKVLAYIEKEDSPRSLTYQLELMKKVGFGQVEVLHKNLCFAAFIGVKEKP